MMSSDQLRQLYADAVSHHRAERLGEAESLFRRVAEADPDHAEALHRLGIIAQQTGRWAEAAERIQQAIRIGPPSAGHHYNLALALHELDRYEEAAEACRAALRLKPDFIPALYTLGLALKDLGRLDEAVAAYQAVTARAPDFAEAHYGEGFARLLKGDFAAGWPKYAWRRRVFPQRKTYPQPQWSGEDLRGRTLLIHAEQGLGDTIQFARYAPLLAGKGSDIILEVQPSLVPLLSQLPGVSRVIGFGDPLPPFDLHCPTLGLPGACGTTLDTIPARLPYLSADPAYWRDRLPGRRIGIVWRGNPEHSEDKRRSLTAAQMASCFDGADVTLVSLQKDGSAEELAAFGPDVTDAAPELGDFADTAALVAALDLVVSVDTAVAHLAGALGVACWTMLSFAPDWRWLQQREDSPWYPTMRLFRQQEPGDWQPVFEKMRASIGSLTKGERP